MKKLLLLLISSLAFGQAPNFFNTYLITNVSSTDTTLTFTATDSTYAGSGTSYYATLWDTYYGDPVTAYKAGKAEAILINSRTANTFDVERAQLGTTARNFNTSGRRYKISVDVFSQNYVPAITSSDNGKYVTNNGTTSSWVTPADSVDIVIVSVSPSAMGSQTTNYSTLGGPGAGNSTSESSVNFSPFGIGGRVRSMYIQAKANTCTGSTTFTLQTGAADASSLTPSALAITLTAGTKNGSITGQSVTVTPTTIGNFKAVNASGTGSITLYTITLVIRVPLN